MRVAQVCPYSWSRPGGVQSHIAGLSAALRRLGHEVDVLAPADAPTDEVIPLGRSIPIHDNGSVQRVALGPRAVARTLSLLGSGDYDVVHLHEPMLPVPCLTALVRRPAPLVGTFHMVARGPKWYRVFGPLCRRALGRLAVRIAVSGEARDYVAQACPGDYHVVPNGITVPRALPGGRDGRRVVFIGRDEPRKGLPVLLGARRLLPDDVRFDLVGPEGSFGDRTTAHGRVGDHERDRLLGRAAVLCAPSVRAESFGIVLLEALAAGVPVVCSDLPGYRRVVPEDAGILVPPGDERALAGALRAVLDDEALRERMARAGRAAAERYDWAAVAPRVAQLYERAVA